MRNDVGSRVSPRGHETCMHGTAQTLCALGFGSSSRYRVVILFARIRCIFLRNSRQVNDGVRNRVGTTESNDDSRRRGRVGESNIATAIRKKWACVPCL